MDNLETLLACGKIKASYILVKVIKRIDKDTFIIADTSKVAVLNTEEGQGHGTNMIENNWYKLIKCTAGIDKITVKVNRKFRPVRVVMKQDIPGIDKKVHEFEQMISLETKSDRYTDFETLNGMDSNTKVDEIVVKVVSTSRTINTNRGNYQISTIKDVKGNKTSLNLYSKFLNKLEPLKVYKLTNIRRGEIVKNDMPTMRLHTTGFTRIEPGSVQECMMFENVRNGDATIHGQLIGIGDILNYRSCKTHFKKVSEDDECSKCRKNLTDEELTDDFRFEMYIEENERNEDGDSAVIEILVFKRTLKQEYATNVEEKMNEMVNKKLIVIYNIDDASRNVAVLYMLNL